jgi:hypothetical protein
MSQSLQGKSKICFRGLQERDDAVSVQPSPGSWILNVHNSNDVWESARFRAVFVA